MVALVFILLLEQPENHEKCKVICYLKKLKRVFPESPLLNLWSVYFTLLEEFNQHKLQHKMLVQVFHSSSFESIDLISNKFASSATFSFVLISQATVIDSHLVTITPCSDMLKWSCHPILNLSETMVNKRQVASQLHYMLINISSNPE